MEYLPSTSRKQASTVCSHDQGGEGRNLISPSLTVRPASPHPHTRTVAEFQTLQEAERPIRATTRDRLQISPAESRQLSSQHFLEHSMNQAQHQRRSLPESPNRKLGRPESPIDGVMEVSYQRARVSPTSGRVHFATPQPSDGISTVRSLGLFAYRQI